MAAGTVRDWAPDVVRKYLRANGRDIAQAAMRGDKIALKVMAAYQASAKVLARVGSPEANNLMDALNDYVLRDLNAKEREYLAGKIGHRIGEEAVAPGKLILPAGFDQ